MSAPPGGLLGAAPPAARALERDRLEPGARQARPPRHEFIERSHQRSAALGLSRGEKCELDPMVRSDLAVARERNQRLFAHATPVMHLLFEQIVDTDSMIVLTDTQGTILHSVGDTDFLARADKVALAPGENWAEHAKGTNAIGTALFEATPTLVHANEHFMLANSFLTCSAAPIFDPRGNMLGVLDVTGDCRGYHRHTMGLVRMSARMIENHWLGDDYRSHLRLHFHARADFIGTLLEGIVVVGPDDAIVGANRSALDQLGLGAAALRLHSLASLFGTSVAAIVDHFRSPLAGPMRLRLHGGQAVHVSARIDGPARRFGAAAAEVAAPLAAVERPAPAVVVPSAPLTGLAALCSGDQQVGALVDKVRRVLDREIPLLIVGETGTGKELLARAVHHDSRRAGRPFVVLNCAAMTEARIEAELFGHDEAAASGRRRHAAAPGRLVQANGGTLFLDEVGDMPMAMQGRLLQVLQERRVVPPGGGEPVVLDIAVIAATQRNLRELIGRQAFRDDLYYRLNGLALRLPALRERSDLDAIAQRLLAAERPHDPPLLDAAVRALFHRYAWPGNVRQLASVLRAAVALAGDAARITTAHLPDDFLEEATPATAMPTRLPAFDESAAAWAPLAFATDAGHAGEGGAPRFAAATTAAGEPPCTLEQAGIEIIRAAVEAAGGNISLASKQLGISRNTIYRKLRWNAVDPAR